MLRHAHCPANPTAGHATQCIAAAHPKPVLAYAPFTMSLLDRRGYFEVWQTLTIHSNRKQTPQPPKAWQGPNPITQRASNSAALANGNEKILPKIPAQSQQRSSPHSHADKHAHDRLLFLLAHCTVSDTKRLSGQYSGVTLYSTAELTDHLGHRCDSHTEKWRAIYRCI